MYSTIQSPASLKAESMLNGLAGLRTLRLNPVLCCPVAEGAIVAAEAAVGAGIGVATSEASENGGEGQGECPDSSLDFTAAVTYVPPGRLSVNTTPVSDNASVDELISAVRGDGIPA